MFDVEERLVQELGHVTVVEGVVASPGIRRCGSLPSADRIAQSGEHPATGALFVPPPRPARLSTAVPKRAR